MDGLGREIPDGSTTDEMVKAFQSALARETGPERCIELLRPGPSAGSPSGLTVSAMLRDAEKDCIPGPNLDGRVLRPEALCQTAVLIAMCGQRKFAARAKLVREIVTHHHDRQNRANHHQQGNGDAEYWQERTEFHIEQSKLRGQRLRNSKPSDVKKDMEARKKMSEMAAGE